MRGYRDEGSVVNEKHANSDALTIYSVLSVPENPLLDDYVVMILASRSILHIKSVLRHYQETTGSSLYDVSLIAMKLGFHIFVLCNHDVCMYPRVSSSFHFLGTWDNLPDHEGHVTMPVFTV